MPDHIDSESIIRHSVARATEEAVVPWALASAQYPLDHKVVQNNATVILVEAISSFSLNARRLLEVIPDRPNIQLAQSRWKWVPKTDGELVTNLWDALNRVIHARKLEVGWEVLPPRVSVIDNGAIVVPYIQAETDRRALAFIDPFSLAHAFLYTVLPLLSNRNAAVGGRPN